MRGNRGCKPGTYGAAAVALLACMISTEARATDFTDPGDMITYMHRQRASHSTLPEIDGTIVGVTSAKPAWYGLSLKLDNGKLLRVVVAPATKFYKDYSPIAPAAAYPLLVNGCKVRALHDPDKDESLRNIIVADLMFESPPVESAGTIKLAASSAPGVYDLTVTLDNSAEHHFSIDQKTKFWRDYKPVDLPAAYPQLAPGQKIRAMEKRLPGDKFYTSDVMFVDK